jgi:hypothetical protein
MDFRMFLPICMDVCDVMSIKAHKKPASCDSVAQRHAAEQERCGQDC